MGRRDPLRGTGKIRDDKEVIKSNSFRGHRIKEQADQSSKIKKVNHLEKEVKPSQYINTGFKSKKKKVLKRDLAYKKISQVHKQVHKGRRNQDSIRSEKKQGHLNDHLNGKRNPDNISGKKKQNRINAESKRKPVNHASSQISANIKYSSSPRASTGHANSMILAKKDFKRAIKSDARHESHISMILGQTEKARFSENITRQLTGEQRESPTNNSKLKDQLSENKSISQVVSGGVKRGLSSSLNKVVYLREQDDLGVESVAKTRNAIVRSSRTIRNTKKASKLAIISAKKTYETLRRTYLAAKGAFMAGKLLLAPMILKIALVILLCSTFIFIVVSAVGAIVSFFTSSSYISDIDDLEDTWVYITELDANLEFDFYDTENQPEWSYIDEFHYYMNLRPVTDAEQLIAYLTTKYDDFTFKDVEDEITDIHDQLYTLTYNEWQEEYEECTTDEEGETTCVTNVIYHLDIELDGFPFDQWVVSNGNLTDSEIERYESIIEVGGSTLMKSYATPFVGIKWMDHMSSRYGYRIHPIDNELKFHNGLDIALPTGTEINSVSRGTAYTGFNSGKGNYVVISNTIGKQKVEFEYLHMDSVYVTNGQEVSVGDVIGTVGNTGASTGSHLHLTYKVDGKTYNPLFHIEE